MEFNPRLELAQMFLWLFTSMVFIFSFRKFPVKRPDWVILASFVCLVISTGINMWFWRHSAFLATNDGKYANSQMWEHIVKVFPLTLVWIVMLICFRFIPSLLRRFWSSAMNAAPDNAKTSPFKTWMINRVLPIGKFALVGFCFWMLLCAPKSLGKSVLPHLLGIEIGLNGKFPLSSQVMLPFIVAWGSCLAFLACITFPVLSIRLKRLRQWPIYLVAAVGMIVFLNSWAAYHGASKSLSAQLSESKKVVASIDSNPTLIQMDLLNHHRRLVEYRLGTREWNSMVFHRLADEPFGLPFRFPGFLIGVEQANRYLIGAPDGNSWSDSVGRKHDIKGLLDNRRRTFVSHIVEYRENPDSLDFESILTHKRYNIYEDTGYGDAFNRGFRELKKLQRTLRERLAKGNGEPAEIGDHASGTIRDKGFTHILVFCMGWNTDQQESIRNYNSLMGFVLQAARNHSRSRTDSLVQERPFRPLVIGLSWPSEWQFLKPLSYLAKAGDADETGLVWGSYLVKKVLKPLKEEFKLPLVLVGHSFGARVLSRAVASNPDWVKKTMDDTAYIEKHDKDNKEVDLFVGLQGAVSANRFVKTGPMSTGWWEGSPYIHLKELGTRFIFTWAESDKANPLAAYVTGANHMGGKYGGNFCLQHNKTFWPCIYGDTLNIQEQKAWGYTPGQHFNPETGWSETAKKTNGVIFSLNLSKIVKVQPFGKGGGGHSDIYNPEIGNFLWKSIVAFAPGNFEK